MTSGVVWERPRKPSRVYETLAHTRRRHEERLSAPTYPELDDPELAAAWRSLQLHWLRSVPGYREEIRERVSKEARRIEHRARRIEGYQEAGGELPHFDVDRLGPEVEGCG